MLTNLLPTLSEMKGEMRSFIISLWSDTSSVKNVDHDSVCFSFAYLLKCGA